MSIGAACGRDANRLANARLQRGGQTWALDANHPLGHCIHGGREGFGQQAWTVLHHDASQVRLRLHSADGAMGFPGDCQSEVVYRLQGGELHWEASAQLDAPCPINIVQHSYWNLDAQPDLAGHQLHVPAPRYHPTDALELPLPAAPVAGTPLAFESATRVPTYSLDAIDAALCLSSGLDADGMRHAATLSVTDLAMTLHTDRALLHVYAGSKLHPTLAPLGVPHLRGAGICLETEDMPNGPAWGVDVWYGPSRPYRHRMRWDFCAQE